jgi:hypothetical protein
MDRAASSRLHDGADESADAIVAALAPKFLGFLAAPFALVLAMRAQREREAMRIAAEFRCDGEAESADDTARS